VFSTIHTPILPSEIQAAFWLPHDIYTMAMESGALGASYSDTEDPTRRLRLHNLSDAITLAVMLALGWPIVPAGRIAERVESVCDDLWFAWEENLDRAYKVGHHLLDPSHRMDSIDVFVDESRTRLHAAVMQRDDLSPERKTCLLNHNELLISLVRDILLESAAALNNSVSRTPQYMQHAEFSGNILTS